MFETILIIVSPVFGVILLGFLSAQFMGFRSKEIQILNRVNLYVLLPLFIFVSLQEKPIEVSQNLLLIFAGSAILILRGALTIPVLKWLGNHRLILPPMMFNNSGNMGLPILLLAFGEDALIGAVLLFLIENTLHFSLGQAIMSGKTNFKTALLNPMILAAVAGIIFNVFALQLPEFILLPFSFASEAAIPLLLFSLGVKMCDLNLDHFTLGIKTSLLVPLVGLISYLLLQSSNLPLNTLEWKMLLIYAVLPPALLNYLMAENLQIEPDKMAAIVLYGNASAVLIIPIALSFVL